MRERSDSGWHRDRRGAFAELKVNLIAFSDSVFDLQGRCTSTAFDKGQDVYASHGQQFRNHSCWTWSLNEGKAGVPESHV